MNRTIALVATSVALWSLSPLPALAAGPEKPAAAPPVRPWAAGVPKEKQDAALKLFREGNDELKKSFFPRAVGKYEEALRLWNHPAIHYNLALALGNLDRPIEVREHLEASLKFGPEPLDATKFEQARLQKSLVEKQLSFVVITCDQEEAVVTLDGRTLFTAPGRHEQWVRSGPHAITANAEGYLPTQYEKALPPGEVTTVELKLFRTEDLTQYRRRWSAVFPWAVVAGGAVAAGTGGFLHSQAAQNFRRFDAEVGTCGQASPSGGCPPGQTPVQLERQGRTQQTLAYVGYGVGAAALAGGAILVYANRLQPYQVNATSIELEAVIVPSVGPDGAGAFAVIRF